MTRAIRFSAAAGAPPAASHASPKTSAIALRKAGLKPTR